MRFPTFIEQNRLKMWNKQKSGFVRIRATTVADSCAIKVSCYTSKLCFRTLKVPHKNVHKFLCICLISVNNKRRSYTQHDTRKQNKNSSEPLRSNLILQLNTQRKQIPLERHIQKLKKQSIATKSVKYRYHCLLMWEIGPANNTTRCSGLSKRCLPHAWHPSQAATMVSKWHSKRQIQVQYDRMYSISTTWETNHWPSL